MENKAKRPNTMLFDTVDATTFVLRHTKAAPSDEEWDAYLAELKISRR